MIIFSNFMGRNPGGVTKTSTTMIPRPVSSTMSFQSENSSPKNTAELVFADDDDANESAESIFSNMRIYERALRLT